MALDFPASPTTGQTYAGPGGAVWQYDGAKWVNGASAVGAGVASFNTRTGAVTLSSGDVTTALTFTPYNATNPSGYQTAANVTTALTPYAPLASPPLTGTPTVPTAANATATTQAASTAFVRTGTTTNDNAAAGQVGEYISSILLVGAAVPLTNGTPANITTISLTAGDWDVHGNVCLNPAVTTVPSLLMGWISTVSATQPVQPNNGAISVIQSTMPAGGGQAIQVGRMRLSLAATTTVYLSIMSLFTTSTCGGYGFVGARRAR